MNDAVETTSRKRRTPHQQLEEHPTSKAKAVRAYWWDMEKVAAHRGSEEYRAQRDAAETSFGRSRDRAQAMGWPAVVRALCFGCVGGDPDAPEKQDRGPDPAPRTQIRECQIASCPLHRVRVWTTPKRLQPGYQAGKTRVEAEKATSHGQSGLQGYAVNAC